MLYASRDERDSLVDPEMRDSAVMKLLKEPEEEHSAQFLYSEGEILNFMDNHFI